MIEIFFACSYDLFLLYVWYRSWKKNNRSEVGYSTGKWSDDDDYKGPITPFIGPNR
jgi:hypothetical protein